MRQGFTIELTTDEEIEFSTVANSNKVRINAEDKDGDAVQIEVTVTQAKAIRDALGKAIALGDNPYAVTINSGAISAQSLINEHYASLLYGYPQRSRFF